LRWPHATRKRRSRASFSDSGAVEGVPSAAPSPLGFVTSVALGAVHVVTLTWTAAHEKAILIGAGCLLGQYLIETTSLAYHLHLQMKG
jgi:hypothetical protein